MSTWYPDNIPRRNRAKELDNDITQIQQRVKELKSKIDDSENRLASGVDEILRMHDFETTEELQDKLLGALSPQDKKMYEDLVKASEDAANRVKKPLKVISTVLLISGLTSKAIDVSLFLKTGYIMITFQSYGRAFITLVTEGLEAGKLAFRAAAKVASASVASLKDASKLARYSASASRILEIVAVFGLVADAVIIAFSVYDQHKQREALRTAVHELCISRLISKFYARLCENVQTEISLFQSYVILLNPNNSTPGTKVAADQVAKSLDEIVRKQWDEVTLTSSYDLLVTLDHKRGSWTAEDPNKDVAIAEATKDTESSDPEQKN